MPPSRVAPATSGWRPATSSQIPLPCRDLTSREGGIRSVPRGHPPPSPAPQSLEIKPLEAGPVPATDLAMSTSSAPAAPHPSVRLASDEDLVATLLCTRGTRVEARKKAGRLLSDVGGLAGLARLGEATGQFEGIPTQAAQRLIAAVEIGLRCAQPTHDQTSVVASSEDIVALLGPRLRHLMHEQVWMVGLDARNVVTSRCRVAEGGQHGCALLARDVLRLAVQLGAHAFVLAHNHPGGDPRPSAEDVHLTEQLSSAAVCVGIPLIDHVIVTRRGHSSMLKLGLIPDLSWERGSRRVAESRSSIGRSG